MKLKTVKGRLAMYFDLLGGPFQKKNSFLTLMLKNMLEQNEDERG